MTPQADRLSIVTSLYNSAPYLEEFYERCKAAALKHYSEYEFVLVNDGSPDNSLEVAIKLHEQDPNVTVIDLSRNFGQHKAIMTGLAHATGDRVFWLDCDLEETPEWLTKFQEKMEHSSCDVVYGVQNKRKGGLLEKTTGHVFYGLFNLLSGVYLPPNQVAARLMSARYVKALVQHRDYSPFLAGLSRIVGFEQVPVTVKKGFKGSTSYTSLKKIRLVFNSITSFSTKPLVFVFLVGCVFVVIASFYIAYLLARYFVTGVGVDGWTSLIISVWLIGGMNMFSIGIVGIYLSKVFLEVKPWPYTVIRHVYQQEKSA